MAEEKTGVFSGQYGTPDQWKYLLDTYEQKVLPGNPAEREARGKALGFTPDELAAIDQVWNANARGLSMPTWTREDLWKRVSGTQSRIESEAAAKAASENDARIRGEITQNVQAWIDSLGVADPAIAAQLAARARVAASNQAGKAGFGSMGSGGAGLSARGQASINSDLDAKYALDRKGLQAQGYGLLNNRDLGLAQLEQGWAGIQDARAAQQWAAGQNQLQGIGSAVGAGLGAIGFLGGPAVGSATMAGGSALGGGLTSLFGGGGGPNYSPASSVQTARGGGYRGGSLGNTGY